MFPVAPISANNQGFRLRSSPACPMAPPSTSSVDRCFEIASCGGSFRVGDGWCTTRSLVAAPKREPFPSPLARESQAHWFPSPLAWEAQAHLFPSPLAGEGQGGGSAECGH